MVATFGGTRSARIDSQITPTPSRTQAQFVLTPVGIFSVFGFETPIPYPFGIERTGYLVTDLEAAVAAARKHGADVLVAIFPDPIGRDAIIEWPGGVYMQLYWHTTPPHYPALQTIPENRVYVSPDRIEAFVRSFVGFSNGRVVSDVARAPGVEIGRPADTFRRVRIESRFGKLTALTTDGHLPYPYGVETTGYEVSDLDTTLKKAQDAHATVLVRPYSSQDRVATMVQFPGGYIAEIHSSLSHASAPVPAESQ
jgi:predicted enzyme related to lactoylglutathione lyase